MRNIFSGFALGILFLSASCIPTLHPIYTAADLVFEPDLVGEWVNEEEVDSETLSITRSGDKSYAFVMNDEGEKSRFRVHLIQIRNNYFVDFFPEPEGSDDLCKTELFDRYGPHFIAAHTFYKVEFLDDQLKLSGLDSTWLQKELEREPSLLTVENLGRNEWLITSSTEKIQAFLEVYGNDTDAFSNVSTFLRK